MNPYSDFDKSDMSNVVMNQEYFRSYADDSEEQVFLDMDAMAPRSKDEDMMMGRSFLHRLDVYSSHENTGKKFPLELEIERVETNEWESKPVEDWCDQDTANWVYTIIATLNLPYGSTVCHNLILSGKELLALSRHDFVSRSPEYGDKLYNMLHSQAVANRCKTAHSKSSDYALQHRHHKQQQQQQQQTASEANATSFQRCHDDETTANGSNNASDAESDNSIEISTKRPPGRPRLLKTKKNPTSQGKLWEFIRDLLRNRKTCPSLICWEDYSQAKFRFVRSDEVAKLWGSRKGNTKMTYEKLSRAMRYYYKRKIFLPVLGRRLVYQFGPNATGWQTDNPNFRF